MTIIMVEIHSNLGPKLHSLYTDTIENIEKAIDFIQESIYWKNVPNSSTLSKFDTKIGTDSRNAIKKLLTENEYPYINENILHEDFPIDFHFTIVREEVIE